MWIYGKNIDFLILLCTEANYYLNNQKNEA